MSATKRIISVLLAAAMTASITACGSTGGQSTASSEPAPASTPASSDAASTPPADDKPITLKFFSNVPDRTSGMGLLEENNLNLFRDAHPNVTIEMEALQDEPYKMKLQTYMQSGQMPDLWQQWGSAAMLTPVVEGQYAAVLEPADYASYNFVPGALESFTVDGKLYGLPKNADFWVLFYNEKILKDNGIELPKTTDDLITAAATLKEKGITCISHSGKDKWPTVAMLQNLILRKTGDPTVLRNAIKEGTSSGNADFVAGLNEFTRLVDGGVFQPSYNADDYGTAKNLFIQGQAAMFAMGSWEMGMASDETIVEEVRSNIRAMKFPVVNGWSGKVDDLAMWYGGGYAASANSENKDMAVELLNFLVSPDVLAKNAWEKQVFIPAMKYDQYFTGSENQLQKDLTDIMGSAISTTGDLYNDLHNPSFKSDSENATLEFAGKVTTPEEYLAKLDEYAKEANAQ